MTKGNFDLIIIHSVEEYKVKIGRFLDCPWEIYHGIRYCGGT